MKIKLGFLGIGKIASAVVRGFCTSNIKNTEIYLSPRNPKNSSYLAKIYSGVNRLRNNQKVLDNADIIFLSVRSDDSKKILANLHFKNDHMVISFIPFLKSSELTEAVKPAVKISRAIPLPAVVYHYCPIPVFNPHQKLMEIMNHIGQPFPVENENQLHALWTLTGFIAPFYGFFRELSDWATEKGVAQPVATKYMVDMVHSLIISALHTARIDFSDLVRHSITPKGMNEQVEKEISQ